MLKVKTLLAPSSIHGLGLFADERIPAGTVVWEMSALDLIVDVKTFKTLPLLAQAHLRHYGDFDIQLQNYTLSFDNDRFINHSSTPNLAIKPGPVQATIAVVDIEKGQELTIDYYTFDVIAADKLKHNEV